MKIPSFLVEGPITGHTAVYVRENSSVSMARGLVPAIKSLFGGIVQGNLVKGQFRKEEEALFKDPTSIALEIEVDKETANLFKEYCKKTLKAAFTEYRLRPSKITEANCVHASVLGFVNFMTDYSDQIRATEPKKSEQIDKVVHMLVEKTSEHEHTMQGHMIHTINYINSQLVDADNSSLISPELAKDLRAYLSTEIERIAKRHPTEAVLGKIQMGKDLLAQLEGVEHLSTPDRQQFIIQVDKFAHTHTNKASKLLDLSTTTSKGWNVIQKAHHLNLASMNTSELDPGQIENGPNSP